MRITSQLPIDRTQAQIAALADRIKIATKLNIKPREDCLACRIARRHGQVLWCRCIGNQITPMGRG